MIKNNTVVLGFIYPGIEPYIDDYFHSLLFQTYECFDLYLYNDGMDNSILNSLLIKYQKLNIKIICIEEKYTPAQIREIAILEVADKYNYVIFTDIDDFFSANRIEKSIEALQYYDFVIMKCI
ncbi:glycosyltransferase [Anaerocolumna sedimenticola]|uniref:Glycosyltransferase n=1 Tax=Anaerocolumna sedimenticola TaxID=2696063 RepID=A0A6P1TLZ2_9FIRM|nr:glycosyltransferase family A protein [Anaerocolumna sedimenticola]QHQ60695.1 glycosyltransferase [Anaerocolumna sedimenticola]